MLPFDIGGRAARQRRLVRQGAQVLPAAPCWLPVARGGRRHRLRVPGWGARAHDARVPRRHDAAGPALPGADVGNGTGNDATPGARAGLLAPGPGRSRGALPHNSPDSAAQNGGASKTTCGRSSKSRDRRQPGPPPGGTEWPRERFRFRTVNFTYGRWVEHQKCRPTELELAAQMGIRYGSFRRHVRTAYGSWRAVEIQIEAELAAPLRNFVSRLSNGRESGCRWLIPSHEVNHRLAARRVRPPGEVGADGTPRPAQLGGLSDRRGAEGAGEGRRPARGAAPCVSRRHAGAVDGRRHRHVAAPADRR